MGEHITIGRVFGIIGTNAFFVGLVAMILAMFTKQWAVAHERNVIIRNVPTDADIWLGIFDISIVVKQYQGRDPKTVENIKSYALCSDAATSSLFSDKDMYCSMLSTVQFCSVISLCVGLTAGVISALMSSNAIRPRKFKSVACAAAMFMVFQITAAIICFATFMMFKNRLNNDLDRDYPGVQTTYSYSFYLAVVAAGFVLIGIITTSALGKCGSEDAQDAYRRKMMEVDEDEELPTTSRPTSVKKPGDTEQ